MGVGAHHQSLPNTKEPTSVDQRRPTGDSIRVVSETKLKAVKKKPLKHRLKELLAEYGKVAVITYFVMFIAVICGFAIAIKFGFKTDGAGGAAGTWGVAWLMTKATQPIRILATLAITPGIAAVITRIRGPKVPTTQDLDEPHSDDADDADDADDSDEEE